MFLVNLPPFSSPYGAYLYVVAHFFVGSTIWEDQVEVGPPAHSRLSSDSWSFSRVRALNGAIISSHGDTASQRCTITVPSYRMVTVVRPENMTDAAVTLRTGAEPSTPKEVALFVRERTQVMMSETIIKVLMSV